MRALSAACRGIRAAVRAHYWWTAAAAALVLGLQILLPPLILSLARKPCSAFTLNPWLKQLPSYLAGGTPIQDKLSFLSRVALFWFTADGQYEPEWGFAVDTGDLARFVFTAGLVGTWVALVQYQRDLRSTVGWRAAGRGGGAVGAVAGVLGLSTGPCSVVGCGAPVLPVVGLAFAGLSSGTVLLLSTLSQVSAMVLLAALGAGVAYLGWRVGTADKGPGSAR
jgi:hypothetical protein